MHRPQLQLAAARPLPVQGAVVSHTPPLPVRLAYSSAILWFAFSPVFLLLILFVLFDEDHRHSDPFALYVGAIAMLVFVGIGFSRLHKLRGLKRALQRGSQLATVSHLEATLYPYNIQVNRSRISGYNLQLDVYDPVRQAVMPRTIHSKWYATPGTQVIFVESPAGAMLAAYLDAQRGWTAFPPFRLG